MSNEFEITVDDALFEDDEEALALKLSAPLVEVNVLFSLDEARALARVLALGGNSRGVPLGASAGSRVHWARGSDSEVYLLIGDDDQTWDVGVTLSMTTFRTIVAEIEKCL